MSTDRLVARKHAEWLSLIEISGPFLSMPVLLESFPQGLDLNDDESQVRRRVRLAYDEWIENQQGHRPDPAIHTQWLRFVLEEVLEMRPDAILEGQQIPADLCYEAKERGETLRPLMVIRSPYEPKPRLLIQLAAHKQDTLQADRWQTAQWLTRHTHDGTAAPQLVSVWAYSPMVGSGCSSMPRPTRPRATIAGMPHSGPRNP